MTDRMAAMGEIELVAAIRKGCNTAEVHLSCSYPECGCKQMPTAIKAAIESLSAPVEDEEKVCREILRDQLRRYGIDPTKPDEWQVAGEFAAIQAMREYARRLRAPVGVTEIHAVLSAANIPYSAISCDGCNVFGDEKSIKRVAEAFHAQATVPQLREYIVALSKPATAPVGVTVGEPALTGLEEEEPTAEQMDCGYCLYGPPALCTCGTCPVDVAAEYELALLHIATMDALTRDGEKPAHEIMREIAQKALDATLQANGVSGSPSSPIQTSERDL